MLCMFGLGIGFYFARFGGQSFDFSYEVPTRFQTKKKKEKQILVVGDLMIPNQG